MSGAIKRNGSFFNWAERRVINSFLSISSFVIAAYFINYVVLSRFVFKQKYRSAFVLFLSTIIFLWVIQAFIGYVIQTKNYRMNPGQRIEPQLNESLSKPPMFLLLAGPIVIGSFVAPAIGKRIWIKQRETEQVAKEKTRAELSILKSQIHPHFLFNTLNNIYYFTLSASQQAPTMIRKLSGMLRYIISDCNQPFVPLEGEIKMIQDYIALEKIRYGEQIQINIKIQGDPQNKLIAPLLMIPLVENGFKHGASKMIDRQWVILEIDISNENLHFLMKNNKPAQGENGISNGHVGLKNVKKRLQLLYPEKHELNIFPAKESFSVSLKVKLSEVESPGAKNKEFI